jgi:hypothetical protein
MGQNVGITVGYFSGRVVIILELDGKDAGIGIFNDTFPYNGLLAPLVSFKLNPLANTAFKLLADL